MNRNNNIQTRGNGTLFPVPYFPINPSAQCSYDIVKRVLVHKTVAQQKPLVEHHNHRLHYNLLQLCQSLEPFLSVSPFLHPFSKCLCLRGIFFFISQICHSQGLHPLFRYHPYPLNKDKPPNHL